MENEQFFAYKNHALICSLNQPVLHVLGFRAIILTEAFLGHLVKYSLLVSPFYNVWINCALKDDFYSFSFFSIDFFYIYIYCSIFNSTKLIKTAGHCNHFFRKNDVEHTPLCQQFWLYLGIFIFSLIKSLTCNKTLNILGL